MKEKDTEESALLLLQEKMELTQTNRELREILKIKYQADLEAAKNMSAQPIIRHYTMGEEDQIKLIKAGFRIIRSSPAFSTIYQRTAENFEWHPLVENIKDLPTFEKRLQKLVKDDKTVLFR